MYRKMKSSYKNNLIAFFVIPQIFLFKLSYASDIVFLAGAREMALAHSGVSLGGIWSVYYNPAGLATVQNTSFGIGYENKFMVKDLNTASCALSFPLIKGTVGTACSYFGGTRYNEKKFAVAYAHKLASNLSAGILVDYFSASLPEGYDDSRTLAGELGLLAKPLEKLSVGLHIANISGSGFKYYSNNNLPQFIRTGVTWTEENFTLITQAQISAKQETIISVATEINILKNTAIRMGASNNESMRFTFGFGYALQNLRADIAFAHHDVLGMSSSFSLVFSIKN
jgi:hypothetical protein